MSYDFNKFSLGKENHLVNAILCFITLITITAVFTPFSPIMPGAGADASWQFGMNQAVSQGLSFGKDIIFTYGPYASIRTWVYHPATDVMIVSASLYLAFSYWICFVILMKGVQWYWVLAFCIYLAGFMFSKDSLLFSFPLLVGLSSFKIINSEDRILAKSKLVPFYVTLLFAPLGLLPLIKGSVLILSVAVAILCAIFFIVNRDRLLAIICLLSPLTSMFFFWIASGQPGVNLSSYFISMAPIVSGYTEAMSRVGWFDDVSLYLIASIALLRVILIQTTITISAKIFLFCIFFIFLFLSFKAGFTRHDSYRAIISGGSILNAALLLPFVFNIRVIFSSIVPALIVCFSTYSHYTNLFTDINGRFKYTYSSAWHGIENRIRNKNWPKSEFDNAINSLQKQVSFPVLQGTTDIYSFNQSYLISSGNEWSPRPIFQSYSAYTPALAELNKKHLLGKQAPDNIIFKIEPVDGRIPSIEDGVSWPILISNYRPTRMENDFLFLQKKESIGKVKEPLKLTSEKHAFGEKVILPYSSQLIFAQIEIAPTFLGNIATFLFKSSQLQITLELKNGIKKQYRIIASMAKSGFLISPLIETTAEFGMLYDKMVYLDGKLIKAITITTRNSWFKFWDDEYTVTFSQVGKTAPIDTSKIYIYDQFDDNLSSSKVSVAKKCDGVIEAINTPPPIGGLLLLGRPTPVPADLAVSNYLFVSGWLAASVDKGTLPEAVYVVLTDSQGRHKFLRTRQIIRPIVGAHYNSLSLNKSGYSTSADISALEGEYTVGLSYKISGNVLICPEFKVPVTITN